MKLTWYQARLTEVATQLFGPSFPPVNSEVYWAVIPANHSNRRVVVVSDPERLGTPRVVTAHVASHMLEPTCQAPDDLHTKLDTMCEKLGFFKKFCYGEASEDL